MTTNHWVWICGIFIGALFGYALMAKVQPKFQMVLFALSCAAGLFVSIAVEFHVGPVASICGVLYFIVFGAIIVLLRIGRSPT